MVLQYVQQRYDSSPSYHQRNGSVAIRKLQHCYEERNKFRLYTRPHIGSVYRVDLQGNHPCFVKIILTKNDNFDLTLQKRRFCNAKQPLLPCKTYAFGTPNNRFCNALITRWLCDRCACEKCLHLCGHINIGNDYTLRDISSF